MGKITIKNIGLGAVGHDGYSQTGLSIFTRSAASSGNAVGARREPGARPGMVDGFMDSDEKIRRTQIAIGKLESLLMFEQRIDAKSPKIAKLEKSLRIKRALLTEYGRERNDPNYRKEKVRV
jgi:hypothetical protein